MDDAIRVLSADTFIRVGGWHPKYALVLLIEHNGDHAHGRGSRTHLSCSSRSASIARPARESASSEWRRVVVRASNRGERVG